MESKELFFLGLEDLTFFNFFLKLKIYPLEITDASKQVSLKLDENEGLFFFSGVFEPADSENDNKKILTTGAFRDMSHPPRYES